MRDPRIQVGSGDTVALRGTESRPAMLVRIVRVHEPPTCDGWVWVTGDRMNAAGATVERTALFVPVDVLRRTGRGTAPVDQSLADAEEVRRCIQALFPAWQISYRPADVDRGRPVPARYEATRPGILASGTVSREDPAALITAIDDRELLMRASVRYILRVLYRRRVAAARVWQDAERMRAAATSPTLARILGHDLGSKTYRPGRRHRRIR